LCKNDIAGKIIISCRSDYLGQEDDKYFQLGKEELEKYYIAPVNYKGADNLKSNIEKYLATRIGKGEQINYSAQDYLKQIKLLKLEKLVDTGLNFKTIMEADIFNLGSDHPTRIDIYKSYIEQYAKERLSTLSKEQQERIKSNYQDYQEEAFLQELGESIASILHITDKVRIDESSDILKYLKYNKELKLSDQAAETILGLLPLKIEKHVSEGKESLKIGFLHDTFKNYYIVEKICKQLQEGVDNNKITSPLLSSVSIVEDIALVKFFIEHIGRDELLKESLMNVIKYSKENKSPESITAAANAITILVGAKHSFSGEDLSNIAIKGANVRNGIFDHASFKGADLTEVDFTNADLNSAILSHAVMQGIKLSIHPDLLGHSSPVSSVSFSPDGKYIVSGASDKTVKLWDAKTGSCLQDLKGHSSSVWSVSFSPDGKYIVSGASDETVKLWDAKTGSCLQDLKGHSSSV